MNTLCEPIFGTISAVQSDFICIAEKNNIINQLNVLLKPPHLETLCGLLTNTELMPKVAAAAQGQKKELIKWRSKRWFTNCSGSLDFLPAVLFFLDNPIVLHDIINNVEFKNAIVLAQTKKEPNDLINFVKKYQHMGIKYSP